MIHNTMRHLFILLLILPFVTYTQNTVGLLSFQANEPVAGYTLFYPDIQSTVFLIDDCGQIVHQWDDSDNGARPGPVAYLLPDGRLLRAKRYTPLFEGPTFGSGGAGGVIELLSWEGEVLWTYVVANSTERQHHDVHYMPNGHILILAYERFGLPAMIENGFDTTQFSIEEIWSEKIIEIDPATDSIHWEWHAWDHLVQDFDEAQLNFGTIAAHPEKIDLNYQEFAEERADWIHANALDYNPELDQIMISARNFNEIWIIDHSTSTEEAAGSSGGNSDMGGDLIWRWGSPQAYQAGTAEDQQLFFQHDAQWVDDFVTEDDPYFGQIAVFNNWLDYDIAAERSQGQIINSSWNEETQQYQQENGVFLPAEFADTLIHPIAANNFSTNASSIQILEGGHVLMCVSRQGRIFELNEAGELVWEYLIPLRFGQPFPQGANLNPGDNFAFQAKRYPLDYSAFQDRDLSPTGYLEIDPNEEFCLLTSVAEAGESKPVFEVFPNPAGNWVQLRLPAASVEYELRLLNAQGQALQTWLIKDQQTEIDLSRLPAGLYFLQLPELGQVRSLLKH